MDKGSIQYYYILLLQVHPLFVLLLPLYFKFDSPLSSRTAYVMSSQASTSDNNNHSDTQFSGSGETNQIRRRPTTTSTTTTKTAGEQFRRRPSLLDRRNSITRDIEHAAAETYLITHLAFKLLSYLGYYVLFFFLIYTRLHFFLFILCVYAL